jgi:DNA replication protein DnaC
LTTETTEPAPADDVCPICGGAGYVRENVPVGHPDFGKAVPCPHRVAEVEHSRVRVLRSLSNLDAMARFTFETFLPDGYSANVARPTNLRRAFEQAREFAEKPQGWLLIRGGYGCGKTHLAAAIANYRVERGQPALFVAVPDLLDFLRASFSPASDISYNERFEMVRSTPLLILDDLGTENATDWALEKLFQIFNARYNARLATVITTNHELEEIDRRLRSRIMDSNLTQVVAIIAPDFRHISLDATQSELSSLNLHEDQTFGTFSLRADEFREDSKEYENLHKAFEMAKKYAEDPAHGLGALLFGSGRDGPTWLVLTGPHGCGKTHLAAAIANYRRGQGYPALFVTGADLSDYVRTTFNPQKWVGYDKRFEELKAAALLILDDLQVESASPTVREKLFQLLDYRYAARLPTVITTAKRVEEMDGRLAARVLNASRCETFGIVARRYAGGATARRRLQASREVKSWKR